MSKTLQLRDALRDAAEIRDNQNETIEVKEERSKEVNTGEEKVSLTAKVPKSWRRHWLIESKKADTSLTADIIEALTARYGLPPK